jgi:hypothetical protein
MRRAFDATLKDPEYLAEAKTMKMDVDPMTGEDMEALIRKIYATPPALVDRVKMALEQFRDRNAN